MNTDKAAPLDGNAIVFCDGAFTNTYGKTAHGLVRRTRRYRVTAAGRAAFATTVRMVNRVHRDTANCWTDTAPS